jgi:hypothetical protein
MGTFSDAAMPSILNESPVKCWRWTAKHIFIFQRLGPISSFVVGDVLISRQIFAKQRSIAP